MYLVAAAVPYFGFSVLEPPWKYVALAIWLLMSIAAITTGIVWMRRERRDDAP